MSNDNVPESPDAAHLREVIQSFSTAMLVTNLAGVPTGRPMSVAAYDDDGLWFITGNETPKVMEVHNDGSALVTLQGHTAYALVRGEASVVEDREKLRGLWSKGMELWWPEGPDADGLVLLRFEPHSGQYWDMRGTQGLRFLKRAAKALLKKEVMEPVPGAEGHALL